MQAQQRRIDYFIILFIFVFIYLITNVTLFALIYKDQNELRKEMDILRENLVVTETLTSQLLQQTIQLKEQLMLYSKTGYPTFEAEVTAYTLREEECGKAPDHPLYGITASGEHVKPNHTIAMDRSIPFGSKVLIEGFEGIVFTVEDRGGMIKGNCIDIYMEDLGDALRWGRRKRKAWIVRWGRGA